MNTNAVWKDVANRFANQPVWTTTQGISILQECPTENATLQLVSTIASLYLICKNYISSTTTAQRVLQCYASPSYYASVPTVYPMFWLLLKDLV